MKNSLFSKTLFLENLKRFWPILFLGFMEVFLFGPMYILLKSDYLSARHIRSALIAPNFGYIVASLTIPVLAAVMIFMFMQKSSSATMMHSLPLSRKNLFVTSYLSGLFYTWMPYILNGLLFMVIRRPVYEQYTYVESSFYKDVYKAETTSPVDLFTMKNILIWLGAQLLAALVIYSICVFAASISGNSILHALTCYGLNFVIPAYVFLVYIMSDTYLFGINGFMITARGWMLMNPFFVNIEGSESIFTIFDSALLSALYFVFVAAVITFLAYLLYMKRPLEKTGESYVFDLAKQIITGLLVVGTTILGGMILSDFFGDFSYLIFGLIVFVIAQFIIRGTVRIFTKEIILPFGTCLVSILVLLGIFRADLLGMENKVPQVSDVQGVNIYSGLSGTQINALLEKPEEIQYVVNFHKEIIENKEALRDSAVPEQYKNEEDLYPFRYTVNLTYTLKNGSVMERSYYIPGAMLLETSALKPFYEEYRLDASLSELKNINWKHADMNIWFEDLKKVWLDMPEALEAYGMTNGYVSFEQNQLPDWAKAEIAQTITAELSKSDITLVEMEKRTQKNEDKPYCGHISIEYNVSSKKAEQLRGRMGISLGYEYIYDNKDKEGTVVDCTVHQGIPVEVLSPECAKKIAEVLNKAARELSAEDFEKDMYDEVYTEPAVL